MSAEILCPFSCYPGPAAAEPAQLGVCAAIVRTTNAPCTYKAAEDSKYCKKHALEGECDKIRERGGRVCALLYQNKNICLKELPEDCKYRTCDPCRTTAKAKENQRAAKKRADALAEVARLKEEGIERKMCMNPKCCKVKELSEFNFESKGDREGWCMECREKRQEWVSKQPGGKRQRTEADRETARAYDMTPARKEARQAFKEANPERVAQYSIDSRERRRAADPEGYLARNAAHQMHKRNRSRRIFTAEGNDDVNLIDAVILIENMDSVCFFCGDEDTVERPLGIARMDLDKTWSVDNCVPICANCSPMRRRIDARTFIERCVYLQELVNGGASAWFPAELFGSFPYAGQYGIYTASAKTKGISFELTKDQFEAAVDQPCYVCNRRSGEGHKNGLDRVDNNMGYTVDNVRAACGDCNYMKGNLSVEAFKEKVAKIASRSGLTLPYVPESITRQTFHMKTQDEQVVE